jgi:hypothetical protein
VIGIIQRQVQPNGRRWLACVGKVLRCAIDNPVGRIAGRPHAVIKAMTNIGAGKSIEVMVVEPFIELKL